jgi:hypothetical protein
VLPDVELLRIDNATQWTSDDRCRLVLSRRSDRVDRAPHLVIAQGRDGRVVAFGSSVPDALANELRAAVDANLAR